MLWQQYSQRKHWHPTPGLLPGKSHGQRSLVGCSPRARKELDMTKRLHFHFLLSCIGEGNSNPLQCSCLENPRDGRAWWAAVYGVAQSQTWLKWLSSSNSSILIALPSCSTGPGPWAWPLTQFHFTDSDPPLSGHSSHKSIPPVAGGTETTANDTMCCSPIIPRTEIQGSSKKWVILIDRRVPHIIIYSLWGDTTE